MQVVTPAQSATLAARTLRCKTQAIE